MPSPPPPCKGAQAAMEAGVYSIEAEPGVRGCPARGRNFDNIQTAIIGLEPYSSPAAAYCAQPPSCPARRGARRSRKAARAPCALAVYAAAAPCGASDAVSGRPALGADGLALWTLAPDGTASWANVQGLAINVAVREGCGGAAGRRAQCARAPAAARTGCHCDSHRCDTCRRGAARAASAPAPRFCRAPLVAPTWCRTMGAPHRRAPATAS